MYWQEVAVALARRLGTATACAPALPLGPCPCWSLHSPSVRAGVAMRGGTGDGHPPGSFPPVGKTHPSQVPSADRVTQKGRRVSPPKSKDNPGSSDRSPALCCALSPSGARQSRAASSQGQLWIPIRPQLCHCEAKEEDNAGGSSCRH